MWLGKLTALNMTPLGRLGRKTLTQTNNHWSMVSTLVDQHSIILMQLLIISSLKSVLRYVSYHEATIAMRIVWWGECNIAATVLGHLSTYHMCPKIWNSPFYNLLMCLKYCCMYDKQCRPWSYATFCGSWSGSTLFSKVCLSQYWGSIRYTR